MGEPPEWIGLGLDQKDVCRIRYLSPGLEAAATEWPTWLDHPEEEDCLVCMHHTVSSTLSFLSERRIPLDSNVIRTFGWTLPLLVYRVIGKFSLVTGVPLNSEGHFTM